MSSELLVFIQENDTALELIGGAVSAGAAAVWTVFTFFRGDRQPVSDDAAPSQHGGVRPVTPPRGSVRAIATFAFLSGLCALGLGLTLGGDTTKCSIVNNEIIDSDVRLLASDC